MPGQQISGQVGRMVVCFLLERLEHEELLEDLGLTGLPDLSRQEHLIHHRVHLEIETQEVRGQTWPNIVIERIKAIQD